MNILSRFFVDFQKSELFGFQLLKSSRTTSRAVGRNGWTVWKYSGQLAGWTGVQFSWQEKLNKKGTAWCPGCDSFQDFEERLQAVPTFTGLQSRGEMV
ncbi:unnamed protein product [Caenorhabditis nigoni]